MGGLTDPINPLKEATNPACWVGLHEECDGLGFPISSDAPQSCACECHRKATEHVEVFVPGDALNPPEWLDAFVLAVEAVAWIDETTACEQDGCDAIATRALEFSSGVWAYCSEHPTTRAAGSSVEEPPC